MNAQLLLADVKKMGGREGVLKISGYEQILSGWRTRTTGLLRCGKELTTVLHKVCEELL